MRNIHLLLLLFIASPLLAAEYPEPTSADHVIRDFRFASGETLPELRIHYRTLGTPRRGEDGKVNNAVLILHGTTGSGANFLRPEFAGELFGEGQPLDATRYFLILPDGIGHGGFEQAQRRAPRPLPPLRLPRHDRGPVPAGDRGAEGRSPPAGDGHLDGRDAHLALGRDAPGVHGRPAAAGLVAHPDFGPEPGLAAGHHRRHPQRPGWEHGEYRAQPPSLRTAAEMLFLMSNNPVERQKEAPTREAADRVLDDYVARTMRTMDANDVLYAIESSADYDPGPGLERIKAPLLAINFEDDLINPPELGILEREIRRVQRGKAIVIPRSDRTRGHGTHTLAAVWKEHLIALLGETGR